MNRSRNRLGGWLWSGCLATGLIVPAAWAEEEAKPKSKTSANKEDKKSDSKQGGKTAEERENKPETTQGDKSPEDRGGRPDGPRMRREGDERPGRVGSSMVTKLSRLREKMHEDLDLTEEQAKAIDKRIDDHLQSLRKKTEEGDSEVPGGEANAEIKALRDRMKEARDSGDQDAADAIRTQIREKMQDRQKNRVDVTREFVTEIRNELTDEQKPKFQEIVEELRLIGGPRGSSGEMGQLMRVVNNPKVGLSDDQRKKVHELIRSSFSAVEPGEFNAAKVEETSAKIREQVLSELTSSQRKMVLELLEEASKDDGQQRRRGPGRPDGPRSRGDKKGESKGEPKGESDEDGDEGSDE